MGAPQPTVRSSPQVTSSAEVSRSGGAPGTPSTWETPPPACLPRRLVLNGGFIVNDGHHRHLDQQARRLGFADLGSSACTPCWTTAGAYLSSPYTLPAPKRPSAAPSPTTTFSSHLAASSWPASADVPPSSAPSPARPRWASPACGPTWWTVWSPRHGRWRGYGPLMGLSPSVGDPVTGC